MNRRIFLLLSVFIASFALTGIANAQNSVAELVKLGRKYEYEYKDDVEALKYYKQAAEMNDPEGMFLYGDLLRLGSADGKVRKEGYVWIEKAAKAGFQEAIPVIAWMYFYGGEEWERNYEKAYPFLIEASDFDEESNLMLGKMFFYGLGSEKDYNKAFKYLLKSEKNWAATKYLLLQCYALGLGTEPNPVLAQQYWEDLLNDVTRDGYFSIGHSLYYGIVTKQDYSQAVKYLQKAADLGSWEAMFLLSKCYRFGRGVKQDDSKADELLRKSKHGDYDALIASKMMKDN